MIRCIFLSSNYLRFFPPSRKCYYSISFLIIYIYMCVWEREREEKVKRKIYFQTKIYIYIPRKSNTEKSYMLDGFFICQRVWTSIFSFFLMQKYFIKIISVWEIIMIDEFCFSWKSSSGSVDVAMWKNRVSLVDMFKLRHVMRWNYFWKLNGVLWFEKRICDVWWL